MKLLIGLIIGAFLFLVLGLKKVWAFLDLVPETCSFNTANMLPEYKDPGTLQYVGKILENTGYNWRHSGQAMVIEYEYLGADGIKTFDTGRNYDGSYIMALTQTGVADILLPFTIYPATSVHPTFIRLTTSYQLIDLEEAFSYEIAAVAAGGFRIHNPSLSLTSRRITGMIIELRRVTGA